MDFEYDPQKSVLNKIKHGIDFETAKELWLDLNAFEVASSNEGEERYLVVGRIDEVCWTAIVTKRNDVIRIISVRRSRTSEVQVYDHRKRARRKIR